MSDQPAPERVRVSGPLARFADGFRVDLIERGYSLWRAQEQLYLLAHVSRWMEAEGLELAVLTPATLERYFVWRRRQGYRKSLSPLSLRRLLGYLDGLGVLPADDTVPSPVDGLLAEFRRYLLEERGVAARTVGLYEPVARLFLSGRSEPLADDLARLSGGEVNTFVLREARRRSARSAEMMVSALRALLRFLYVQGLIGEPLAAAVPSVARRREDLPRGIAAGQVSCCLTAVIAPHRSAVATMRSCCCCPGWGCAAARSPGWTSMTSTGGRASWWFAARALGRTCCRCHLMSVRRWPTTCVTVARVGSAERCSCTRARR